MFVSPSVKQGVAKAKAKALNGVEYEAAVSH